MTRPNHSFPRAHWMAEQLLQASRSGAAAHDSTTKECLQGCVEIMNKRDLENPVPFPLVCVRQLRRAFLWKVFILGRGNPLAMRVDGINMNIIIQVP